MMLGLGEAILIVFILAIVVGGSLGVILMVRSKRRTFSVVPCPSCRHDVSAIAPLCPHCGARR